MSKKKPVRDVYDIEYRIPSDVRRWTQAAVECYLRGCKCEGCVYDEFFRKSREEAELGNGYKCRMTSVVLELVKAFGVPDLDAHYAKDIRHDERQEKEMYYD